MVSIVTVPSAMFSPHQITKNLKFLSYLTSWVLNLQIQALACSLLLTTFSD
nr:MAG TPA: hypothetical protein [Caudoviricetes sp.]DAY56375.1 MAG TPA: hypothetical protein [Caudoviricetes sp.]